MIPLLWLLLLLQNAIARKLGISLRAHTKDKSESIYRSGATTRRVLNPNKERKEQEIVRKSSRHSTDVARRAPKRRCRSRGKVGSMLDAERSHNGKGSMPPFDNNIQTAEPITSPDTEEPNIETFEGLDGTLAMGDQSEVDNEAEEVGINCRKWDLIEIPSIDPEEEFEEPIVKDDHGEEFISAEIAYELEPALGVTEDPTLEMMQGVGNPGDTFDQERQPRAEYEFQVSFEMRTNANDDDAGNDDYRDLTNEDHRPASNDERTLEEN